MSRLGTFGSDTLARRQRVQRPQNVAALVLCLAWAATGARAQVTRGGSLPQAPLFPPDNWWNVDVSGAPVDPGSGSFINFIGAGVTLHPDFGGDVDPTDPNNFNIYGMVYIVVPGTQPLEQVTFVQFGDQSDPGATGRPPGYPIPVEARTEGKWIEGGFPGGCADQDCHMLIVDRDNRLLYELWQAHWNIDHWEAGSGAVFSLDSDGRRQDGWTSADAAGLAILPGLVRYDEAFGSTPIRHAFRFTVQHSNGHAYPASHDAGATAGALPMGTRLRLKAATNISGFTPEVQRIFQAMKTYGLIVADNGSNMFIQGTYDTRWDNSVLNPAFGSLAASDFEVVKLGWQPPKPATVGPLAFYTLAPCRVVDTRNASGPYGAPALAAGTQRVFVAAGQCGVPASARAISGNLTVVAPQASGFVRVFPGDGTSTNTLTLGFSAGQTRANNAVIGLASSGSTALTVESATAGFVQLVLDVNGYFQ